MRPDRHPATPARARSRVGRTSAHDRKLSRGCQQANDFSRMDRCGFRPGSAPFKVSMHNNATLVDLLSRRAAEHPSRRVFSFLRDHGEVDTITYGELDERARRVGAALAGVEQARALLLLPQSLAFIEALFGCFHAGVCAVPAHPPN